MSTLNEILYQAVDGSFAIDANQRIIYWDTGCEEMLGYSENWVLGRPCYSVLKGCNAATGESFCKHTCCVAGLAHGGIAPKSFMIKVKDNETNSLTLSVNIILVPSSCKNSWHVMHLLHKTSYPDVLTLLENKVYKSHVKTKRRRNISDRQPEHPQSRLTAREKQVLGLMSEGISGLNIANKLHISITTVRNHTQHLQQKLGVHSKTEAVAYAYRHHFL